MSPLSQGVNGRLMPVPIGLVAIGFLATWLGCLPSEGFRPLLPIGSALAMAGVFLLWKREGEISLKAGVLLGILLRLAFLPLPPSLSTDVFRYLWDGHLGLAGINPYLFKPVDPALAQFADLGYIEKFNSPEYYSVYPPVMQLFFLVGALGAKVDFILGYGLLKLLLGACEVAALLVLARWLSARQLLLYAWNPFVIVETWGQAHGEAIVLGALAGCLWFLQRRPAVSVALLTVATWAKLWPVLLFPFLFHRLKWRWRYFAIAGGITILLWLPYASLETFQNFGASLKLYTHKLEWNAGLYEMLYHIRWGITNLLWWADWLPEDAGHLRITAPLLRLLLVAALAWLFWKGRNWPMVRTWVWVTVLFVLSLSIIHPWYLAPVFFFLPMFKRVEWSWYWLGLTSAGTYLVYTHGAGWHIFFLAVGWIGWLAILIAQWRRDKSPPFKEPLSSVPL